MKRLMLFAVCLALLILFGQGDRIIPVGNTTLISKCLALIILGSDEFANASERCYNLTSSMFGNYEVLYLSTSLSLTPRANMTANRTNLQWALTSWLNSSATPDTQVWIWIFSHGVGLFHHSPLLYGDSEWWTVDSPRGGGRPEMNSDEGPEITEYLINRDVDGDGVNSNTTWVGVDEGLYLFPPGGGEIVWDDEFKDWLAGVRYRRMVIYMGTCRSIGASENETGSCFSGGFIDDLSAPRRIIISPTNETYYSWGDPTTGIGYFEGPFMDALTVYTQAWNDSCDSIDSDGVTSVLEAYKYAYDHDMSRKAVRNPSGNPDNDPWRNVYANWREIDECPWLDDGGNFLPTFANGTDVGVGPYGYDSSDGELARYTWLVSERYSGCVEDVNEDLKVDGKDVALAALCFGCGYPAQWNSTASLADVNEDNKVDGKDIARIALKFGWHH